MLEKLGYSPEEAAGMITRAFALETELADGIKTSAEEMSPDFYRLINNEMSRAETETLCSAFPWLEILDGRGWAGVQRYRVQQPAYLQKLDGIYREDRLEDLKDFLIARTADLYMLSLDRESYDLIGTLYSVYGIEGIMPDEKIADIGFSRFGSGTYCLNEIHPMKKILLFILALCLWHHGRRRDVA